MEYKDYYATLGVTRTANADEIKRTYRKLARKYHPDVSKEANAEEKFKEVQEAYEVLKDPQKRAAYDQLGSSWQGGQEFHPPPGWQGFSGFEDAGGNPFEGADLGGFSDFFANLFGGGGARVRGFEQGFGGGRARREHSQRGEDQHAKISITLEEAYQGANKLIQLQAPEIDAHGQIHQKVRTLKITIPKGVTNGQELRLAKQGLPGIGNAPAGDLYLEISILPNAQFSLQGKDIYLTLPVTPWEAALGAKVPVKTLGGTVDLKIPENAQAGQKLRLKGRGLPGNLAGDQYVVLQIVTPAAKTAEQRAFYEKMAKEMPFDPRG